MGARQRVADAISGSPAGLLLVPAIAALVYLAIVDGGFPPQHWYPAGVFVLGLLLVGCVALPRRWPVPPQVALACALLAAYALWSYASVSWADEQGSALDGANRTALYAALFALFALWRLRAGTAAVLVGGWAAAIAIVAGVGLVIASGSADPNSFFIERRLFEPVGYQNANVALWTMAFFPCVGLAARRELAPPLRGALLGGAVVLAGAALMGQSRGWVLAAPLAAIVLVVFGRDRARSAITLLVAVLAAAAAAPSVLDVYSARDAGLDVALGSAVRSIFLAAGIAGVAWAALAWLERARPPSRAAERRAGSALRAAAAGAALVALVAFVAVQGSPVTAVADAWDEFKAQPTPVGGDQRLTGSLGSNRYDFWRVAWNGFESAPLHGIGADNFQQDYLRERATLAEPLYPHSVELRALSQTGIVGALLLFAALSAALGAAWAARRERTALGAATAATAATAFAYWLLHGSIDWFFEFPALGGAAFAVLGIAAGLRPRRAPEARFALRRRTFAPVAVAVVAVAVMVTFVAPWIAVRYQRTATSSWGADPAGAFTDLDRARRVNPLSATPDLLAGTIALRLGEAREAERRFRAALERNPRDFYAHLELGMILSRRDRAAAESFLVRARRLNPRDDLALQALRTVRRGRAVDVEAVNRELAARSEARGR